MSEKSVFVYDPEMDRFAYPAACPFDTSRAGRMHRTIESMGLLNGNDRVRMAPVPATREELERCHRPAYLDLLREAEAGRLDSAVLNAGLGTPDCPIFPGMVEYAELASGATLLGARLLLDGSARMAFNPSGGFHHAMPERAAGFCYVNDIAAACMVLADASRRVLFLDLDVHHCDGVQKAFYDRRDVMTVSLHESGRSLFPGTGFEDELGVGEGVGFTANIPLPVGTYDAAYERAFREAAWPLIEAFAPDVLVVELGMDTLAGDPLAHLHLTNNAPADILARLRATEIPILATGGGGYHIENTVRGWALCWSVLCGEDHSHDLMLGMGGVMLQNTDWVGGLRDRPLLSDAGRRETVDAEVDRTIRLVRERLFPLHGLSLA